MKVQSPNVFLNAESISVMSVTLPIRRSNSESRRVARLSVMTTESERSPAAFPAFDATGSVTRLGCPPRARSLVIIATIVCGSPVPSASLCTTSTGRFFAVFKLESGNRARTTSPLLKGIICPHLRSVPILRKRLQAVTKVCCLRFVNTPGAQVDGSISWQKSNDYSAVS